jgi:hypothetical protein
VKTNPTPLEVDITEWVELQQSLDGNDEIFGSL